MADYILEMKGITKAFFGVKALNNVNLQVKRGEIHAIVGENGAGKSTLMNVLSGTYPYGSYEGQILYDGEECRFKDIKDSEHKGIVIIRQELALIQKLTVAENLFIGNERASHGIISWNQTNRDAQKYLDMVGFKYSPETYVKDISTGPQQLLEIAKALAKDCKLLILDEPTASLPETDSTHLLNLLRELQKQGITSIMISHKLNEICAVADRITVIRDGQTICTMNEDEKPFSEPTIVKNMVGRPMEDRFPDRDRASISDEIGFEIRNWSTFHPVYFEQEVVKKASLVVHKGEIVGLYGLMGAGRTEMALSVFGRQYGQHTTGQVFLNGKELHLKHPKEAIKEGLAYLSEDRKGLGLILDDTIRTNISLASLKKISKHSILNNYEEETMANQYVDELNIKCNSILQPVRSLSGGNQQKVALGKWLASDAEVFIFDEPTRGIDVGAKYEIYCLMNDLAQKGKSVLFISSDLVEILGMSDRIYVMNEGEICGQMPGEGATQEKVMQMIVSHQKGGKKVG